jgi:hypothetical protein
VSAEQAINALVSTSSSGTYFFIATVICFAAFLAGTIFLAWNVYLLLTNQTTIEFYGNHWGDKTGNPYDLGTRRNVKAALGELGLWELLIPRLKDPPADGVIYPLNAGRGMPLPQLIDERQA